MYLILFLNTLVYGQVDSVTVRTDFFPSDTIKIEKVIQQNVNLRDFFSAIANQYDVNIYVDQNIQVMDSYRFYQLQLGDLISFVAKRHNLVLKKESGVYRLSLKPPPKPVEKPQPKPKELDISYENGKLAVNLTNEPIRKVIEKLSAVANTSILLDPKLNGNISGFLNNISLSEGIHELFKINGFRVKKEKGIYKVYKEYRHYTKTLAGQTPEQKGFYVDYTDSLITLDIPTANLGQIINVLVQEADLDVIFYDELQSTISMKLRVTDIEDAFGKLLRNTKYTYKKEDGIYYFGERNRKDLVIQEVVELKYLRAGKGGNSGFKNNSNLTASSRAKNMDLTTGTNSANPIAGNNTYQNSPQRSNNSRLNKATYSLQESRSSNAEGFTSEALFTELSKRDIDAVPLLEQNAVLITGTKLDIEDAKRVIRMLDRPIPQILIEALVIDIKDGEGLNQEIQAWRGTNSDSTKSSSNSTSYLPFQMLFNASDLNYWTDKASDVLGFNVGKLPSDFYAFVKRQETKRNIKIRSKPQIATLNGHEAYISVGETRYYKINSSYVRDANTNTNTGTSGININERWVNLEINNTLQIKPWVNLDGDVTVEIKPVLQSPRESPSPSVPPSIDVRELESTVRLKNGETIILGGLITEEDSDVITDSFPLLSWIPWLGDIFVTKKKSKTKSELMIYVTPHVYVDGDKKPFIPKSDFR